MLLTFPVVNKSEEEARPPRRLTHRRLAVGKQTASGIARNLPIVRPPQNRLTGEWKTTKRGQ